MKGAEKKKEKKTVNNAKNRGKQGVFAEVIKKNYWDLKKSIIFTLVLFHCHC